MSSANSVEFSAQRWQSEAANALEPLAAASIAQIEEVLRSGAATVVKHRPHRTVYRVDLPDRSVFVKRFRTLTWRDAAKSLVRGSGARYEWRKSLAVAHRGLPTAGLLAWGEDRSGWIMGGSVLLAEAVADSVPLDVFVQRVLPMLAPSSRRARVRRELIDRLAGLCAQCHMAGVLQTDLHGGNVLVQFNPPCDPLPNAARSDQPDGEIRVRLFLIDLPSVRLRRRLGWRASRNNLATLCAGLMRRSTRSDRWRFWRRYLAARSDLDISCPRRAAAEIDRCAQAQTRHVIRSRDRRSVQVNCDFYQLRVRAGVAHAVQDVPRAQLTELLSEPGIPLRRFRHQMEKISHSSLLTKAELSLRDGKIGAAYKRSRAKRWWKRLWGCFRRDRAMDGWRRGHALLSRGIATARPLMVCRPVRGRDSFLATEWIDGAKNLHLFLWRIAKLPRREKEKLARDCVEQVGRLVGRMHAWRIAHRDLKGANLVAAESDGDLKVYLIDLDGLRFRRWLPRSTRGQNLARLAVSLQLHPWITRPLRLRFLRAYLQELGTPRDDWKRLWREVAGRCDTILRSMRRQGRNVA